MEVGGGGGSDQREMPKSIEILEEERLPASPTKFSFCHRWALNRNLLLFENTFREKSLCTHRK
jgi:hypothetical protein